MTGTANIGIPNIDIVNLITINFWTHMDGCGMVILTDSNNTHFQSFNKSLTYF